MPVQLLSNAEAAARAFWLVDNSLVDIRAKDLHEGPALKLRLESLGLIDERVFERAVDRFQSAQPNLFDTVTWLCTRLFHLREGIPELSSSLTCRRLARIVDPDCLAALHPELRLPEDERFDWGAVPLRASGETVAVLRDESVDTHIHLGGALPPLYYWVALMGGELPFDVLAALPNVRRGHANRSVWQKAAARAMWLRMALAREVQKAFESGFHRPFRFLPSVFQEEQDDEDEGHPVHRAMKLFREHVPEADIAVRNAVLCLTAPLRQCRVRCAFVDPLRNGLGEHRPHYAEGERRLLALLGAFLRSPWRSHPPTRYRLESWLLDYLRIRNAFHQILAYDHGTDGLLRFVETFGRRGFLFGQRRATHGRGHRQRQLRQLALRLERDRMATALDAQLAKPYSVPSPKNPVKPLRRLEMRVSVPAGPMLLRTLRAWLDGIRDFEGGDGPDVPPHHAQVGLLFHFIKTGNNRHTARRAADEARRLGNVLATYPDLRSVIIGIDAAGDERRSHPRIFGRAFDCLNDLQRRHRVHHGEPAIALGKTFHVGEDADDLLTGLRHIWEVTNLLLGGSGGRLGHALALAEDPRRFYRRRGGETEPILGSHLLDIVWAWGCLGECSESHHLSWLEQRVRELSGAEEGCMRDCFRDMSICRSGDPKPIPSEPELLATLLPSPGALDLELPVPVSGDERWLDLVDSLQSFLRRHLRFQRLCIEANPTSNLIIGGYRRYEELPYQRLIDDDLAVSLNTDDPGLFVTTLPGELAVMYQALKAKMGHRRTVEWLAARVFDADQCTFLGPRVPIASQLVEPGSLERFFRFQPP